MLLWSSARVHGSEPPVWKQQERSRLICKSRVCHANAQVLKCTLNSQPSNSMTHQRRRSAWLTAEFSILLSDSLSPSHPASISKGNNNLATIYMRRAWSSGWKHLAKHSLIVSLPLKACINWTAVVKRSEMHKQR